jgi:hypothetical protein
MDVLVENPHGNDALRSRVGKLVGAYGKRSPAQRFPPEDVNAPADPRPTPRMDPPFLYRSEARKLYPSPARQPT